MNKILTISLFILLALSGETKSQWVPVIGFPPPGGGITDMVVAPDGNIIVTRGSFNYPNGQLGGISWSSNGGFTWTNALNVYTARTLELGSAGGGLSTVYASAWNYPSNEGLYRSISGGMSWTGPLFSVGANDNIFAIEYTGNNTLFIGTRNGVLKSTSGGTNFVPVNNGIPANSWVYDLDALDTTGGYIIGAATTNGVFLTSNLGGTWALKPGNPLADTINAIEIFPYGDSTALLIAGSRQGNVYRAPLNQNLSIVQSFYNSILEKLREDTVTGSIYLGARQKDPGQPGGGIFLSTNTALSFSLYSEGLPQNPPVSSLAMKRVNNDAISTQLYAGLYNNTMNGCQLFTRNVPIGITQISNQVPQGFSLSQNYPNPFNPTTNIEFAIPKSSFVKLAVYDMLGREVEILANKELTAGTYKADWDASNYPSGVYFYKIITPGFTETKKMILVK
jgi:hypothetical protein